MNYYTLQRGPFRLILDERRAVVRAFTPLGLFDNAFRPLGPASEHNWTQHVDALEAQPFDESTRDGKVTASTIFHEWAVRARQEQAIDVPRILQQQDQNTREAGHPIGHLPSGEKERLAAMRAAGRSYQADDGLSYDPIRLWVDVRTGVVYHGHPGAGRGSAWSTHLRVLEQRYGDKA
jgi:hypothetical protein